MFGKSSFINKISKKTSAKVGNKPGVTLQKQWIKLNDKIELLDTPGVLWPKFENEEIALNLSYTGTIKDEVVVKEEVAISLLKYLYKNYRENIKQRYKINDEEIQGIKEENIIELYYLIGKKRGAIIKNQEIDETKVANIILEDFRTAKLGRITLEKCKTEGECNA